VYSPDPPDDDNEDDALYPEFLNRKPQPAAPTEPERRGIIYRGQSSDPTFGFLIALALCVGLIPLIPENSDLRYVIGWSILALFGVMAWLLGTSSIIEREKPENLVWGAIFGVIIAVPFLIVGGGTLATTAHLLFRVSVGNAVQELTPGAVVALVVFVQPLAETLFFRGVMQEHRAGWLVALLASLWSMVLFFPMLDIGRYPGVGIIIGTALVLMNAVYSYVRGRNGLAAAWLCQIVVGFVLLFLPFITT
jgi:hypothetical protein